MTHIKNLAPIRRPKNIQNINNAIKLSEYRLGVTRLLHRENFLNPGNSASIFYGKPPKLLPFFCALIAQ